MLKTFNFTICKRMVNQGQPSVCLKFENPATGTRGMRRITRLTGSLLAFIMLAMSALLAEAPRAGAGTPSVVGARINGNDSRTRFVVDLTGAVGFNAYVLPDPYRVMIDLPPVTFKLKANGGQPAAGLIEDYRFGPLRSGQARIVIETAGPVLIEKSFVLKPTGGQPARLVLDLVKASQEAFNKAYGAQEKAYEPDDEADNQSATPAEPDDSQQASAAPDEDDGSDAEAVQPAPPPPAPAHKARRVVVIDPGHGGIDPGAISPSRVKEKEVVLAFGLALKAAIQATGKFDVVMTRDDDEFISLKERVHIAREHAADLFIAIHADTVRGQTARGATLYTLSEKASDAEAEALAQKENQSDLIAGVDVAAEKPEITDILIDLVQRESKAHSIFFARKAADELRGVTLMTGKPIRSAGFVVLKALDIPSVLLELGYLSSASDEQLLTSKAWRIRTAAALAAAIERYFATEIAQQQ